MPRAAQPQQRPDGEAQYDQPDGCGHPDPTPRRGRRGSLFRVGLLPQLDQSQPHVRHVLSTAIRVLAQAARDQLVQLGWDAGSSSPDQLGVLVQDCGERVRRGLSAKRRMAGQHLEQHATEREDVAARVDIQPSHLLRRHVPGGAEHGPGLRRVHDRRGAETTRRRELGEAEIEDLDVVLPGDDHVLRLKVAVDDTLPVGRGESGGDLHRQFHRLPHRHCTRVEELPEVLPLDQLRHDVVHGFAGAFGLPHFPVIDSKKRPRRTDIMDGQNVGMVEGGDRAGFPSEPAQSLRVGGELGRQHLDGDVPPESRVPRAVHLAHAASAQQADDLVRAEQRPRWKGHR